MGEPPAIHEADLGPDGSVVKGRVITRAEAEARRKSGLDVVVCGADLSANRALARMIETGANGLSRRCPPHPNAGPRSLPHYQPEAGPPSGHAFYETPNRKAA